MGEARSSGMRKAGRRILMPENLPPKIYQDLGLTDYEYERIVSILGRQPNYLELSMFSVMWSEHCSYKSSQKALRDFPTEGERVIQGPGENAGIFSIGNGLAIAMKIESHNHPSAVEPYQGAATGVGGIIRDIFAMGARPIANLNSLRFGPLDRPKVRYLLEGVVAGIGGYSNCVGIPTIGGEVYFEDCYEANPLVNAMCVGLVKTDTIIKSGARGIGNKLILIGSATGRDGIHGATFASDELDESSEERRPSVQVGDPFTEKLVMEACLELVERGLLVSLQDLGAAGLTSSSSEMAAKGGVGLEIDISRVPLRGEGMQPFEIMISESQERMLAVAEPDKVEEITKVCDRWGIRAAVIGQVTEDGILRVVNESQTLAEIPARALSQEVPLRNLEVRRPAYLDNLHHYPLPSLESEKDLSQHMLELLASPNLCSRQWVYRQYDQLVETNTIGLPGADAGVVRIKGTHKALAFKIDGNGRYCYLDPFAGGQIAVAEAARNLVCRGAQPVAMTDCLNFGNPEKPEIYWQFVECMRGMSQACRVLGIPVVSGNVSFYNENFGEPIYPTPTVGMAGLIEDMRWCTTPEFKDEGDLVVLLGETHQDMGGSEYLKLFHDLIAGQPPALDLDLEKRVHLCCLEAIRAGLLRSAHDCSEGGLAVAVAESCILGGLGATVNIQEEHKQTVALFSESQSRIVVSLKEEDLLHLEEIGRRHKVPVKVIGMVGGDRLTMGKVIHLTVTEMKKVWEDTLESIMRI
ncbi:phosphoribosylformylglycinamidine synthase [Candidatus Hakubella thermalkaliphila]|nr:phosphoribosylformylglycinamidine synthase [Candidatus Hakubella thermalkaliphila]